MSRDTLEFLVLLLNQVSLPAGAPDFEEQAAKIVQVKRELLEALDETKPA